ncbi:MAG: hypothetical protein ACK5NC_16425 [Vibrio sp.]
MLWSSSIILELIQRFVEAEKKLILQERAAEEAKKDDNDQTSIKAFG